ncbi:unnamed protein product [Cuscuta campestris]|uniref:Carbohydrate kinase PfkB domain-containing protein n=1 Tax=Cuscuta campestris TaxID=132261 RepID=A0A484KRM6_9ASTE|nr:unnamed protein product [Cuscuta campestris]
MERLSKEGQSSGGVAAVAAAEAVVIGGMVLDINCSPAVPANPGTTTPGKIIYTLGGVARNIAECMSKLGAKPNLISAVGVDMAGNLLLEHWKSAGLSIEGIRRHHIIETATVCHIYDSKGEVAAGVANVEAVEKFLTTTWIHNFKYSILSAPVLLLDANLNPSVLQASCRIAAEGNTPVWFEPVSVLKSRRIASIVNYITFASPNEDELIAMGNAVSGADVFHPLEKSNGCLKLSLEAMFQRLKPAISVLLDKGVKVLIVTIGSNGAFLCFQEMVTIKKHVIFIGKRHPPSFRKELFEAVTSKCPQNHAFNSFFKRELKSDFFAVHFPAMSSTSVARLTGAGDCLVGGTLASWCAGLDFMQSLAVGIAAAKAAVEVDANVPAEYSLSKLADDAGIIYAGARPIFCPSML